MKSLQAQLKRQSIINQLNKLGIHNLDGQDLKSIKYTTLLKLLAVKRTARQ